MSDNIDIPVTASGDDDVNRVTSAVDRLTAAMERLGSNSALDRLAQQMELMQATMVTGFANLAATSDKMITAMTGRQTQAIEDGGAKAAAAIETAGLKIKAADARTWEQIQRGSAANVTAAFAQLAEGIPIEAVLARFGELAAGTALSFDGQVAALNRYQAEMAAALEKGVDRQLEIDRVFAQATVDQAAKAAAERQAITERRDVEEYRMRAEASTQLQALIEKRDLEEYKTRSEASARLQAVIEKRDLEEYQTRSASAARLQALIEKRDMEEYQSRSAASAQLQALIEKRDLEEYRARAEASAQLQALIEKRDMEEYQSRSAAAQRIVDIEQRRDLEIYNMRSAETSRLAEIQQRRDMEEYTAAQAQAQRIIDIEQRRDLELHNLRTAEAADRARAADRDAALNVSYRMGGPQAQARTQVRAILAADEGLDPTQLVGSKAAADAAGKSLKELHAIIESGRSATTGQAAANKELAASYWELEGALKQAEGAFRGAAHQAGIYGLHHGQLIAMLAGGAVAAGLHHVAETGAEVEFQLSSLNALGDKTKQNPIDFDKFIGITAGSMTSLKDAAEGVHALAQAGQTQAAAFAALPDVMRLASLGEMTVAQASEMAVESMHAFGKEATDLGHIGDVLVAVGAQANLSVHKLAEDMKSAAVTGALFNLNMEEITATVGALAERGLTIQPLSSALNKLYEPSAKTAKVMHDWGLSVKDSEGNLKNYTKFMGELVDKVAEFRVPADALKQLGMSPQSIKAMEVMTQHFESYKHLLHEADDAQGKMFDAMTVKENTAEGTWKRLGSTVEGTLTKAFVAASPIIRQVEEDLMHLAGSEGVVSAISNLAAGVARMTKTFVENLGALTALLGAYVGMRMLSGLTTMVNEYVVAKQALALLTAKNTALVASETVQLELFAVAETQAAAAGQRLALAAEVSATGMRLMTSALGWIGIAVVGLTAAFDLLAGSMSDVDRRHQEEKNSYDSTTDAIQREIDRLKELEEQLNKTGKTGSLAAAQVHLAYAQMKESEARGNLEAAQESTPVDSRLRMAGRHGPTSRNGDQLKADAVAAAQKVLDDAHNEVVKAMNLTAELETRQTNVKGQQKVNDLRGKIEELPSSIKPVIDTAAARAAAEAANRGLEILHHQEVTEANVVEMAEKYDEVQKKIAATKREINTLANGDKDGARVAIERLQEQLRLEQMLSKSRLEDAKSQNKRGDLGDLELINKTLTENLALHGRAVDIAKAELAAAGPLKGSQQEKYNSRIKTAEQQLLDDKSAAARSIADLLDKMSGEELQYRAKTLAGEGQLQDAYNLEWEAKYGSVLDRLNLDIENSDNAKYRDGLVRYRDFLNKMHDEGEQNSIFKMDMAYLDNDLQTLKTKLADIGNHAGPGVSGSIGAILDRKSLLESSLPQLQEDYAVAKSDAGNDPTKLKAAAAKLKEIQAEMAALRNIGVDIGNAIAQSLTDAFGQGGAALGGLIVTATAYDTRMQDIRQQLADSDGGAAAQKKAADDMAAAQINAYGSMAGAAKGFFDQNSKGYKILHTSEQAFRAIELANAASAFIKKTFFKTAEVTQTVAGDGIKMTSGTAATAVDVANAGASGTAWGIAAVARSISSLPFPANLAAGAATMAALVALGIKLTGGFNGGGQTQAEKEQQNATGTVLGDRDVKSESLSKSLALVEKNTYNNLVVAQGMLSSLRSIEANIKGFVSQLFQSGAVDGSGFSTSNSGLYGALKSGTASGAGALLGGGVGYAAGAGLTAFTSMAALGGPIGLAIGVVAGKFFGSALASIFGGKQSIDASGFTLSSATLGQVASGGANAMAYADITTSGGWFSSDKHNTKTQSLGEDANLQISRVITGMGDAITSAAGLLGEDGADFRARLNGFVVDIGKIDLKGLSSADAQAKVAAVFSKLGDQMAQAAFGGLEKFQQAGEGYLETLTRVASDYATVDAVFRSFGVTYAEVGTASIAAREQLIEMAGGLDKFTSQASWFFENMMTKAQQTAATRASIEPTLAKYGLSTEGPDAVKKFTDLTLAMGAMGSAGAQAYTDLMNIAQAFKSVTDVAADLQSQIDDLTQTQAQKDAITRGSLDPANQLLFDQLQQAKAVSAAKQALAAAYRSEAQSLQTTVDKLKNFAVSLHNFVNSLQVGNMSLLNPADRYGAAQSTFETTLAKAKAGDTEAQSSLQSAAQAFLQASRDANASNSVYQSDYQRVVTQTNALADWASGQVTEGMAQLAALNAQIKQLTDLNGTSLDMMSLISDTGMSIVEAISNLTIALTGGKNEAVNTTALVSLYQELLHRAPDQEGLSFWGEALKNGTPFSQIVNDFKTSPEYLKLMGLSVPTTSVTPSTQYGAGSVTDMSTATAQITNLYKQLLNRMPDAEGLDFWTKALKSGTSLSTIVHDFVTSTEYLAQQAAKTSTAATTAAASSPAATSAATSGATSTAADALTNLYQTLLGRAPDAKGYAFWMDSIKNGTSLDTVKGDFLKSAEYQQLHPTPEVTTDSYSSAARQTAEVVAQLATLNKSVSELRTEQQTQSDQQAAATMQAAANTADDVAEAVTIAAQKSSWAAKSAVALR